MREDTIEVLYKTMFIQSDSDEGESNLPGRRARKVWKSSHGGREYLHKRCE